MSGQAIVLVGIAAGSASLGSTVLAGLTFAAALGGPFLGAILDRSMYPGRVLAAALSCYALGIGVLAWSIGHLPFWVSMAIAAVSGVMMPAISGGWSSRLKSFIAEERIARASAIDAATFNIAGLAGPAVAGLVAVWLGVHWAIAMLVMLLVAALPMAWALPKHQLTAPQREAAFLSEVLAGLKSILANWELRRITLLSMISYTGIGMLWVICPLAGVQLFGHAGFGGVMMALLSAGALLATIAYAKWPTRYTPDTIACATTVLLAGSMVVLAFAGNVGMVVAAMLLAGFADGPQLAAIFTVRHREAPLRHRSQVFTAGASLKISAAALGVFLAGQLAAWPLRDVILVAAFIQCLAAAAYFVLTAKLAARG